MQCVVGYKEDGDVKVKVAEWEEGDDRVLHVSLRGRIHAGLHPACLHAGLRACVLARLAHTAAPRA